MTKETKTTRPDRPDVKKAQVYATIGDGVTIGVNEDIELVIEDAFVRMSLGPCTLERLDNMKGYLDQMRPHAIDYKSPES